MKYSLCKYKIAFAELWPFLLAAFLLTYFGQVLLALVIVIGSIFILKFLCRKRLNPFFVIIRLPWLPWNLIAQNTDTKAVREALCSGKSCDDIQKWLLHSMVTLFNDLPRGHKYCCQTHELVYQRLERWKKHGKIRFMVVKPCGKHSLRKMLNQILGHKCRKCKNKCGWNQACDNDRPFYYIRFYKY